MKILTILTYYSPHWTGLTAHAVLVAEGLAARGHDVTVLTTQYHPSLAREEMINGVRVIRLRPISRFSRGMIAPAFPLAAARTIRKSEVVHIHTPLPESLYVALLCRLFARPLVMTHHGDLVMPSGVFNQMLEFIGFHILAFTGRLADRITSYSRDYAEHSRLLHRFVDKLAYVYPPVEIPKPDDHAATAWRSQLGLEHCRLIGFAGRWVEEKGFDYLLRALPIIRKEIPDAHLVFAGEKDVSYERTFEQYSALVEANRDHITFLGLIRDRQQMAEFYAMCDLFVLPSRSDMMALTQIEAMLCGTPVVANDIPGARVVVRETGFGLLSPPGDPHGLAETIIEVLANRERYQPTAKSVREIFDNEKSYAHYESILQGVLDRRRVAPAPNKRFAGSDDRQALIAAQAGGSTPSVRYRGNDANWASLLREDEEILDRVLGNEADMAYRRRAKILLDYLELKDGERLIDLGCGMGFYLLAMAKLRKMNQVGLDGDFGRLRIAHTQRVPADFAVADVSSLPFADGSFDKVLMSEVLEHLADDQAALCQVFRLLKPGGILAISVPHAQYPFLWDPISRVRASLGLKPLRAGPLVGIWTHHVRLYSARELVKRLEKAGFEIEVLEEATHYCFPFMHFIVYGLGKPLLEKNLLPRGLRNAADRFSAEKNSRSWFNPINLGVAIFMAVDRLNERPAIARKNAFVNVLVKARKPQ